MQNGGGPLQLFPPLWPLHAENLGIFSGNAGDHLYKSSYLGHRTAGYVRAAQALRIDIFKPIGQHFDIFQAQRAGNMAQKGDALQSGLNQNKAEIGQGSFADQAGKPGPAADIDERTPIPAQIG